jgi:hypothetical protein
MNQAMAGKSIPCAFTRTRIKGWLCQTLVEKARRDIARSLVGIGLASALRGKDCTEWLSDLLSFQFVVFSPEILKS